jgi:hypothetical protein
MPFVGGYIGSRLAPEKIVEVPVPETPSPEQIVPVASTPIEESEFTDVDLPQVEWKDNQNEYTVAERSQYRAIANGERIANFFYQRKDDTIFVEDMSNLDGSGAHIPLSKADVATFEINTLWPSYARDKNYVYILGKVIEGADPKTFVPVCGFPPGTAGTCGFSKDAYHVYWYTKPITGADVTSFAYLYGGKDYPSFALDTHAVYEGSGNMYIATTTNVLPPVTAFADGSKIHFSTTTKFVINESKTWAPYLTSEPYSDGTSDYLERVSFSVGTQAYSLYEKLKKGANWYDAELKLSKVATLGYKPAEVK